MEPVCIGSQLFLNKSTTVAEVEGWVVAMAEAGLRLIRLFLIWDHLEPAPGRWSFEVYDAVFDQAAAHGMGVVPTLMSVSPPGWMLRTSGVQAVANLEDPEVLAAGERYIRRVVERWGPHPALHSWILWNEASRIPPVTEESLDRYRDFLRRRFHGDLSAMNATQFRQYASFDEVGRSREGGAMDLEFAGFAEKVFWQEFAVDELMHHLQRIAAVVREGDPIHPLHVNPHGLCYYVQHAGQSIWREAEIVDFLGCSSHPVWHSSRFPRERWTRSCGIFADLMRSATPHPERGFWVTELQGGTTLLSSETADCPAPDELTRWMWEGIGAGARATVFWCFNWRDEGYEAGEWHLLRLDGKPSARLKAASRVAHTLMAHADWFTPARPWTPNLVILRSDAAERLAWVEGDVLPDVRDPRNRMRPADSAAGAALLLADLGHEVGYVEESGLPNLLADPSRRPRCLILPGLETLCEGTLERLLAFVEEGGVLIADAAPGWKDPLGRVAAWRRQVWKDLFGDELGDLESWAQSQRPPADANPPPPWWYRVLGSRDSEEKPFWSHSRGRGRAILIPTWFFHRFLLGDFPMSRAAFAPLLHELPPPPLRLAQPGPACRLRLLRHPHGVVGVVLHESGSDAVELIPAFPGSLHTEDATHDLAAGQSFHLACDDSGVAIFRFCCKI